MREWWFYFYLGFRRHFLGVPNWVIGGFLNIFFLNLGFTGVMEKCVGCFLVYLFFWGGWFFYKKVLRGGRFNFLRETYPPKRCNTRYCICEYDIKVLFVWTLGSVTGVIQLIWKLKKPLVSYLSITWIMTHWIQE